MSSSLGVIWDSSFLNHDAGAGHPERAERLIAIREAISQKAMWERLVKLDIREAERHELERNHTAGHVTQVLEADGKPRTLFDGDTIASPGTTKAALRAAGGAIDLAKAVWRREVERGFSLARPPGHHAERDTPMGFCYFNNIAVAARAMLEDEGLERIMIVDWDVHHGNGTQHTFEDDPRVLFCSLHQFPFYPGTGALDEIGRGEGKGYTVNLPLRPGLGDDEHLLFFERVVRPLAEQYKPQMLFLSAGYDSHRRDPLGSMRVTASGFAAMAHELLQISEQVCEGRLVAFLEGGYDLEGLSSSVVATMEVMLGDEVELSGDAEAASAFAPGLVAALGELFDGQWNLG